MRGKFPGFPPYKYHPVYYTRLNRSDRLITSRCTPPQPSTRNSATTKSTARRDALCSSWYTDVHQLSTTACLVGVLYDISREKMCLWLINHFHVIDYESYRIRRNNANYTAITSVKDTDFGNNRKPTCDFLSVINT